MSQLNNNLDKVLALDTAGNTICCTLKLDGVTHSLSATREESRTRNIAILTAELLKAHSLTFADIRGVIVVLGPGSFTGLRVGLSFAKGLVAACPMPLLGISRFDQALYQLRRSSAENFDSLLIQMKGDDYYRFSRDEQKAITLDVTTIQEIATEKSSVCFVDCNIPSIDSSIEGSIESETIGANTSRKIISLNTTTESLMGSALELSEQEYLPNWTELEPLYIQRSAAEIRADETRNAN